VIDQLVILNLRHEARDKMPAVLNTVEWQTCLRRIQFLNRIENSELIAAGQTDHSLASGIEIFRGREAYQFLLEVICGLNSPLVCETAVMGQFREFCSHARFPNTTWGWFLRQFTANVLVDAKRVRHEHLQGIGSQSYGSLVRQHARGMPAVAVLGSGKLAREILPWLIGKTTARVFYRTRENAEDLLNEYPEVKLEQYSANDAGWDQQGTGLVIAAPMKASEVEDWVRAQSSTFSKCLDLRGEAETDPILLPLPVIKLSELFDALRIERGRLEGRVEAARGAIQKLVQRQAHQAQFRPFGWEDLCA
jgi:glutamyl-tRNA reductase